MNCCEASKNRLIVIGQLTSDDVITYDAVPKLDSPGGAALYALGGAFLWQKDPLGLVTRRGNDFDLSLVERVSNGKIDLTGVVGLDEPGIHIFNMFDRRGNRYFINQRWGGMDTTMAPVPQDIPERYKSEAKSYLICAYPIEWQQQVIQVMPEGARVLVDPHFNGVYADQFELWRALLRHITYFCPSEEELLRLFAVDRKNKLGDYIPLLRSLAELGPTVVCVKVGPRGVLVYDREADAAWHLPAWDGKVVDVTGCGDAFCGGFLASFSERGDAYEAAVCGTISSSFNIEHLGALENFTVPLELVLARWQEYSARYKKEKRRLC